MLGFWERLGKRWNISLFHYRNHGAAEARVFAALEVPEDELPGLPLTLDEMGYRYWDETDNPAYTLFLG